MYYSQSKRQYLDVTKMNYVHLVNALAADPTNDELKSEVKRRLARKDVEKGWRAERYDSKQQALWHPSGYVWFYVTDHTSFTRLQKIADALNEHEVVLNS